MYELIKIIFLRNGTVRTNKMKFWISKNGTKNMRKLPKRTGNFCLSFTPYYRLNVWSVFSIKLTFLIAWWKIENKQPNIKVRIAVCNVRYTRRYHPFTGQLYIGLLYERDVTSDLFYDDCLDWNHTRTHWVRGIITKIQLLFTTDG